MNKANREVVDEVGRENKRRGVPKDEIDQNKNEIFTLANNTEKDSVKISFLLGKVADKESLSVSREEVASRVMAMAAQNNVAPEKFVKDLQKRNGLNKVHEQLMLEKAVDFLVKNAEIEEVQAGVAPAAA